MKGLDEKSNPLKILVAAAGLEPTTHSLGNCCSILMSYAANLPPFITAAAEFCKHKFHLRH